MFHLLTRALWSVLFPTRCILCGRSGDSLCDTCAQTLPRAQPLPSGDVFPLFQYNDKRVHKLIFALKYNNRRDIARPLSKLLGTHLLSTLKKLSVDYTTVTIVGVPSSRNRIHERGYDHIHTLIKGMEETLDQKIMYIRNTVKKLHDTERQVVQKRRSDRLTNLRGAFSLTLPEVIKGRVVVIIDDVVTTGATIREMKHALSHGNPRTVIAITCAH